MRLVKNCIFFPIIICLKTVELIFFKFSVCCVMHKEVKLYSPTGRTDRPLRATDAHPPAVLPRFNRW